jgi:hypothetical protein
LAAFQISEWFICRGYSEMLWTRLGFVATSFMPIVGLDLISLLTKKKWPVWIGYVVAAIFSAFFIFLPNAFTGAACNGRFVAFHGGSFWLDALYAVYYIPTTALGVFLITRALMRPLVPNRRALVWMLVGYLAFCLPVVVLYFLVITGKAAVPSVLCGFAVLLALTLALKVLPAVEKA